MPLIPPPAIESSRTSLRSVVETDLPALLQVNSDEVVTRFLPYSAWNGVSDAEAWFERIQSIQAEGTAVQWVVVGKQSNKAIGACLVFGYNETNACAEVGYVLGRAYWGQGYMREALAVLMDWLFASHTLRRLEADIDPRNLASARLLAHLGFTKEGFRRQCRIIKGEVRDAEVFGLLRHEWVWQKP